MFAPTPHLRQADQRARDQRKRDMLLVLLTGLCAIAAGLAMDAMTTLVFLPV
jgi:hypothetical protein